MFWALLGGAWLWGCATTTGTTGPQAEAPPEAPEPLTEPGELARNWLLPSRITDVGSGQKLEPEALYDRLLPARVIYVAENHDNPHDHAVQLQVIDGLHRRDPSLAIGMEMFKRPFQKWVNDFVSGKIDEAAMLEKTQWSERWGFDYALYKPILDYARAHQIPILALNERDEVTRQVSRQGLASLDPVDRDGIPDLDLTHAAHRARIKEAFDAHGAHGHGKLDFENFYTAQVIWDETMAYEVASELGKPNAPRRIVVIAGGGHLRHPDAVPGRAEKRGAAPYQIVVPEIMREATPLPTLLEDAGHFLWLMAKDPSLLPP